MMEQRPSYTPMPEVLPGAQQPGPPMGPPPPGGEMPLMASTAKVPQPMPPQAVISQTPSYTPPPMAVVQNTPSYVPPAGVPAMQQGPPYDGAGAPPGQVMPPAQGPPMAAQPPGGQPVMMG